MKKEKIRIYEPLELLDGESSKAFIPRDIIPSFHHLGLVKFPDALAMYIGAGCVEFARNGGEFFESEAKIALKFQVPDNKVRYVVSDLIHRGIIGRKGKNGGVLKERTWFIPSLELAILNHSTLDNLTAGNPSGTPQGIRAVTAGNPSGGTAGNPSGHLRDSGSKLKRREIQEEVKRKTKTPPPMKSSFIKNITAEESEPAINEKEAFDSLMSLDLFNDKTLSKAYYGLLVKMTGCTINGDLHLKDSKKAELLLEAIPQELKSKHFISSWMVWYVSKLSKKFSSSTHFITRYSDSLEEFSKTYKAPEAERLDVEVMSRTWRVIQQSTEAVEVFRFLADKYGEENLWLNKYKFGYHLGENGWLVKSSDATRIIQTIANQDIQTASETLASELATLSSAHSKAHDDAGGSADN